MNIEDMNLDEINQVDMSMNPALLDDDDSFGSLKITDAEATDDRNFNSKTGIIIDLNDDDDQPMRVISANIDPQNSQLVINKNFTNISDNEFTSYNEIDMDTKYFDEDDEDLVAKLPNTSTEKISIDNPLFFNEPKCIDERVEGEVSKDYWKDISKKHLKSNKKGAYSTHFHLAGNPEVDKNFFNHAMGSVRSSELGIAAENCGDSNITGVASVEGSFGESLEIDSQTDFTRHFNQLCDIINVDVIKNSDNSITLIDLCDIDSEYICNNLDELALTLQPYIEDCFIYPLQIKTGLKHKTCKDWIEWYNQLTDVQNYKDLADDISYCDLIANHLKDCAIGDF